MDRTIIREQYLERLRTGRGDTGVVKVITGMRRAGKSVLMEQYIDDLRASGVSDDRILYIDFEDFFGQSIKNKDDLNSILVEKIPKEGAFYVFLDEIQNVKDWEMSISALNHMGNVDVYITGSNSDMLSSHLATHISGRHVQIEVFPLSYKEFMDINGYTDRYEGFEKYLQYGGLPAVDPSRGARYAKDYLRGVYNTMVVEDVVRHTGIASSSKADAISRFLYSNIGNITNASSISSSVGLSVNTVESYIDAMTDSYLFSFCNRYDMVGKKLLNTNGKYYALDLGVRNAILGLAKGDDSSRPLENIVYIELLRRGYEVRVGSYRDSEVDFIAENGDGIEYYQVCQTLMSEGTRERETKALEKTKDYHPKTILTLDRFGLGNENGIKIVNVLDWLLS